MRDAYALPVVYYADTPADRCYGCPLAFARLMRRFFRRYCLRSCYFAAA